MVCTANELSTWKDFPKGLKVLLLEEDITSAQDLKAKLEAMDYIVSLFCNENEALSAISDKSESFHVAIVEVSASNSNGRFKFLETAKDLPTIMTSNIHCLSTMMKCIALGAVEFLRKPLSEDKLRNIWQHVVHKAFNAAGNVLSESLKPVKDSVDNMLHLKLEIQEPKDVKLERLEIVSPAHENDHEQLPRSDKYPAPSTPQLKQVAQLLDDGDCQDHTNSSVEKDSGEQEGESKSVETTCAMTDISPATDHPQFSSETTVKAETDSVDGVRSATNISCHLQNKRCINNKDGNAENPASDHNNSHVSKVNRKKMKVDWTPELHKKFVKAVEQLGVDQAIPSRILEVMKVEGLTRHNVASHLQKYRMHRRHILPKEDDRRWPQQRDPIVQGNYYPHRPIMAYPSYHASHTFPPVYPVWGATGSHSPGVQIWGSPGYSPWPAAENWHWKPYSGVQVHADAWGCPVMPPNHNPYSSMPPNISGFCHAGAANNSCSMPQNSFYQHPAEEVIDKVVKEAINKPWLPLPLGLKPPSTDTVLAELSRQGISRVPPQINGSTSI